MDYQYIEYLVTSTKEGSQISKQKLIEEFTPLIKKISKTTFISNYTREDIEQECYLTLLKCIDRYDLKMHRFIGYATMAIKNNVNYLIRSYINRKSVNGSDALTSTGSLEDLNLADKNEIDGNLLYKEKKKLCLEALNTLSEEERELFEYVNVKGKTLKSYAVMKDIPYSTLCRKRAKIRNTLRKYIECRWKSFLYC